MGWLRLHWLCASLPQNPYNPVLIHNGLIPRSRPSKLITRIFIEYRTVGTWIASENPRATIVQFANLQMYDRLPWPRLTDAYSGSRSRPTGPYSIFEQRGAISLAIPAKHWVCLSHVKTNCHIFDSWYVRTVRCLHELWWSNRTTSNDRIERSEVPFG